MIAVNKYFLLCTVFLSVLFLVDFLPRTWRWVVYLASPPVKRLTLFYKFCRESIEGAPHPASFRQNLLVAGLRTLLFSLEELHNANLRADPAGTKITEYDEYYQVCIEDIAEIAAYARRKSETAS